MAGEEFEKSPSINKKTNDELIDSDGDGIPDIYDSEPLIPAKNAFEKKIQVTRQWIDSDNDGIPDYYDSDPNSPAINELERSLQDTRLNWKSIDEDTHRQYDTRICSLCQSPVPAKNIVIFNNKKICIDCSKKIRHDALEKRLALIQSKEKIYLQHRHTKVLSLLPQSVFEKIEPFKKKNENTRSQELFEEVIYPEHEFDVTNIDVVQAIFTKLFQNPRTLQKYLPTRISIINKSQKIQENYMSGKILFELSAIKMEWELNLQIKPKKALYTAKLSGKVEEEFLKQFHLTLAEIFHVEQRMVKDKLGWIDAYLACNELEEAENLIQDIATNMPTRVKNLFKIKIENVKKASAEGRPVVDFVICPFCSSSYTTSEEFILHLENDHPPEKNS